MLEKTPPLKIVNPEENDSDFDSNTSSQVYRIVSIQDDQTSKDLENTPT